MHDNRNSLNDDEQQRLRQIADDLERDDPVLADLLAREPEVSAVRRWTTRLRSRRACHVSTILGLVILAAGLLLPASVLGAAGFAVAVVSVGRLLDLGPETLVVRLFGLFGNDGDDRAEASGAEDQDREE